MGRKGRLEEILSKALHADDVNLYTVAYRDFDEIKEIPLLEFLRLSEEFQTIPASRIVYVKRSDKYLYGKFRTK